MGHLHVAATVRGDESPGLCVLRWRVQPRNYIDSWTKGEISKYFINTAIILVPAVLLVLLLASMMAFAVSRYSWRFNLALLMVFTAANLLPPQVIITPLFRMFLVLPLPPILSDNGVFYDQYFGIMVIHVAFQLGFCTFVLSNYMKTLPRELNEAAIVDGAASGGRSGASSCPSPARPSRPSRRCR